LHRFTTQVTVALLDILQQYTSALSGPKLAALYRMLTVDITRARTTQPTCVNYL